MTVTLTLRRLAFPGCVDDVHIAEICVGREPAEYDGDTLINGRDIKKDNPLWPERCRCGYVFKETDGWHVLAKPVGA